MQARFFSDEELVAYLDGETEFAPVPAIDAALKTDPSLRKRLETLALDRTALQEAFAGLVPDQIVMPLPQQPPPRRGLWIASCATIAAAAFALGIAIGAMRSDPLKGWANYVAAYQALYSNSTLAHVQIDPQTQQAELERVAAAIGKSIKVADLGVFPGVDYKRAQILSFEGRALAQLAFLTSTGDPVALCIIRSTENKDYAPEIMVMEGLSTALWSLNGYDYILIGGRDETLITRMSATFQGMSI